MFCHFSCSVHKNYPFASSALSILQFGRPVPQTEAKIVGGYGDAHKALIAWMTDCYQARFVDALPYFNTILQVKIVHAIGILGIELLKCENTRLPKRLESHRFSVNEARDIHNLYQVSPMVQNKVFQNVAGNFVKGSRQDTSSFLWLAYVEENFEMGVRRAIRLLEQASQVESIISAEERWVGGVAANEGRL